MVNILIIEHPEQDATYVNSIITDNNVRLAVSDISKFGLKKSNGNLYHGKSTKGIDYLHYGPPKAGLGSIYIDSRLAGLINTRNQQGGAVTVVTTRTFEELEPRIWDIIENIDVISDEDIGVWKQAFILTISDNLTSTPEEIKAHWWYTKIWRINDMSQEKEDQFESLTKGLNTNELVNHVMSFFTFAELKECEVL
jgi:hypothetical protein